MTAAYRPAEPGTRAYHVADDPTLCCLPGAWDRMADLGRDGLGFRLHGEPVPSDVIDVAAQEGVDPHHLADHVEAVHGWEPHDTGFREAVEATVECVRNGGFCP